MEAMIVIVGAVLLFSAIRSGDEGDRETAARAVLGLVLIVLGIGV